MTAPTQKTHYDTCQKSCVQEAVEYMLAKGIPHDPRDVFEHFSVKERGGYNMIQPGASSCTVGCRKSPTGSGYQPAHIKLPNVQIQFSTSPELQN